MPRRGLRAFRAKMTRQIICEEDEWRLPVSGKDPFPPTALLRVYKMNEQKCKECGTLLTEEEKKCPFCGCPVEETVVECRRKPPSAAFCARGLQKRLCNVENPAWSMESCPGQGLLSGIRLQTRGLHGCNWRSAFVRQRRRPASRAGRKWPDRRPSCRPW